MPFSFSRIARHVRTLGILWIVFAIYTVVTWLLVLPFLHMAFGGGSWMGNSMRGSELWIYGFHPGGWLLHIITIAVIVRALLSLAVGIALLTRQPWGRVFAIIIAVLTLIKPILGTILAIYTLWVLLERDAGENYAQLAAQRQAFPPPAGSSL